ncbi:WG repeat-containing protein [Alkalihalobacterium chitinilyticum]|uniref:WG repeat-containing protein n=1 Tax=Alkalihalobacterium chitinilyticum TaxID=2980103 RepID=A0ABT5VDR7_9BACI|nr:WG repeat-containing protein [Alkalihalobacterium chitinilyticum]MDE5413574.1 WG repeat-containing protein [Alkalihalobacterium chitinilyticum]
MREEYHSIDFVRHLLSTSSDTTKPRFFRKELTLAEAQRRLCRLYPASVHTVEGMKWGYINSNGNLKIPARYDRADDFQENGLAIVMVGDQSGVIDCSGQFVIDPIYESILPFTEGRAIVIDATGFKVIDEKGNVLTSKPYNFIAPYEEERAVFSDRSANGQYLYGYLDRNGQEIIALQFEYANDFIDGKALVRLTNRNFALIDKEGTILNTYAYHMMSGFSEGLSAFRKTIDEPFGYVDENGNIVIEPQFSIALPFQEGRAVVNTIDGINNRYGLIDRQGKFIIQAQYNDILQLGEDRVALGKAIVADKPYYGSIYAIATSDGRRLTDYEYDTVSPFKEGLSSVTQDRYTFFIDRSGKRAKNYPVVQGTGILTLENGVIKAFVDQRVMYFNRLGRSIWKPNTIIPLQPPYRVREVKFNPNKDYLVYYPQIEGMKNIERQSEINQLLKEKSNVKEIPSNVQLDYSYTGDFAIEFYRKNLLVIKLSAYEYPFGAAHGMPSQEFVHINLQTGELYELQDLFKKDADYVSVLSEIIGNQIEEQQQQEFSYFFPQAYKGIKPDQPFYITEDALAIYFQPYEIAAFAAGFPTFKIPYDDIIEIIDIEGSFWRAFN